MKNQARARAVEEQSGRGLVVRIEHEHAVWGEDVGLPPSVYLRDLGECT
jgi:hypothetical protein